MKMTHAVIRNPFSLIKVSDGPIRGKDEAVFTESGLYVHYSDCKGSLKCTTVREILSA